jgi:hypothetical protein
MLQLTGKIAHSFMFDLEEANMMLEKESSLSEISLHEIGQQGTVNPPAFIYQPASLPITSGCI